MKKTVFTLLYMLSYFSSSAQYVEIPDDNFRSYLIDQYPSCFINFNSVMYMDTTCSEILETTWVDVANKGIKNLEGVQYFTSLTNLNCYGNEITEIPSPLAPTLKSLFVYQNNLTQLPILPSSLTFLYCSENELTTIPELPISLVYLIIDNNQIITLPALPDSLKYIYAGTNALTTLPSELPKGLRSFAIDNNQIGDHLPSLPSTITELGLENTGITQLPNTLPSGLVDFFCGRNQLSFIPELPITLDQFSCSFNPDIKCLPALPEKLSFLGIRSTQIACLPNIPENAGSDSSGIFSLPLCENENPNGCEIPLYLFDNETFSTTIFPNPSSGEITINSSIDLKFEIHDLNGRTVFQQSVKNESLDLKLAPGIYFYYLGDKKGKLIIE